jgi:hypothetical protein
MRRYRGIALVLLLVAFVASVVWKITDAQQCFDDGSVVVSAMSRHQSCEKVKGN